MTEMSKCDRCGADVATRRLKEIAYEKGRHRIQEMLCPTCLDKAMNDSARVRGIVGTRKAAAAHLDPGRGPALRQSFGERKGANSGDRAPQEPIS